MASKLFVGNIAYEVDESELRELFAAFDPAFVQLCTDRQTGASRGFGFVGVIDEVAQRVIDEVNGTLLGGRKLLVRLATDRPRPERRAR